VKDADEDRSNDPSVGVGSVAAGGRYVLMFLLEQNWMSFALYEIFTHMLRYDGLVGMFSKKDVPCVGISFGIDRIFGITKARREANGTATQRTNEVDVYVMAFGGDGCLAARMQLAKELWDGGISAEFMQKKVGALECRVNKNCIR